VHHRDPPRGVARGIEAQLQHALVDDGAEGIVLGCTEIELLVGPSDTTVPVFPTTRLHIEAAVGLSLA
jgi:aspartate racemase